MSFGDFAPAVGPTPPALQHVIDDLALLPDWESRYGFVLELARDLPPLPEHLKSEANLVRGCTAQVWLVAAWVEDRLQLQLASDALLVQGLLAVVHAAFANQTRAVVQELDLLALLAPTGLLAHLSANRRSGLASVVAKIRNL